MKLIEGFFVGHLLAAVAALAVGFALTGGLLLSLFVVLSGVLWYFMQLRRANGLESIILFGLILSAALGYYWFAMPAYLPLITAVMALGAWDLDHFLQRLKFVNRVELNSGLGKEHLRRLVLAEAIGLLLGMVALTARAQFDFWVGVGLALLALIGLSRLVVYLKRQID